MVKFNRAVTFFISIFLFLQICFAESQPIVQIQNNSLIAGTYTPIKNDVVANISDPDNDLTAQGVFIRIKSPTTSTTYKVYDETMICEGTSSYLTCSYPVFVDNSWGPNAGITVGARDMGSNTGEAYKVIEVLYVLEPSPTINPRITPSIEPSITPTVKPNPTPTKTPNLTPRQTPTPKITITPRLTPSPTAKVSPTPKYTLSPTKSPTPVKNTPSGYQPFNTQPTSPSKSPAETTAKTPLLTPDAKQTPSKSPKPIISPSPIRQKTQTPAQKSSIEISVEYPKNSPVKEILSYIEVRISKDGVPIEYGTIGAEVEIDGNKTDGNLVRIKENLYKFDFSKPIKEKTGEKTIVLRIKEPTLEAESYFKVYFSEPSIFDPTVMIAMAIFCIICLSAYLIFTLRSSKKPIKAEPISKADKSRKSEGSNSDDLHDKELGLNSVNENKVVVEYKKKEVHPDNKNNINTDIKIDDL
ncbi:MAG: hypothetical protein N3F05_01525 [Candidatus Diapherotrites archaeon]|nr:hypothetical protein [Candidatus Diapherotrites archaeon]